MPSAARRGACAPGAARIANVSLFKTREEMEADEARLLAAFARKSGESRGRKFPEARHEYRTEFQRDRARIIHSRAFRRLEYKTQVFLNGTGDHLRTRLTHTIEVASISRTIARALRLNEDLAEAIALAHDLGHSPFGHSGEEILAECMRDHGGFEHNRQSLRVVELLEHPYPNFPGLNLTAEVREGLQKNETSSLEAQVADLADEITYYSHDLDDAIDFETLAFPQLDKVTVWREAAEAVRSNFPELREPQLHKLVIREIIDRQVRDVIATSAALLGEAEGETRARVEGKDDDGLKPSPLQQQIRYSETLTAANQALRKFLYQNVYYHPRVAEVNQRACEMLREVFEAYVREPQRLGESALQRRETEGLQRAVCDYVAGMTDRYLIEEYGRIAASS
jgi:dGTPase